MMTLHGEKFEAAFTIVNSEISGKSPYIDAIAAVKQSSQDDGIYRGILTLSNKHIPKVNVRHVPMNKSARPTLQEHSRPEPLLG